MKKFLAGICCAALMIPLCAVPVSSEDEAEAADTSSSDSEAVDADEYDIDEEKLITEDEAMANMKLATENSNLALYYNEKEVQLALKDKKNGKIWWSNPINADASAGKRAQKDELKSGMTLIYAEVSRRRTLTNVARTKSTYKMKATDTGLEATFDFGDAEILVPVKYTLNENYLSVSVDTSAIIERNPDKIATDISLLTTFGAADSEEPGYFVIPDGSGALVNFNNGKAGYRIYQGKVYGKDITAVKDTKTSSVNRQIYLPMYGIVKEDAGLMVVADKGDTCATINTYVAAQNKTSYNSCYFDFEIRTSDDYNMSGEANSLKVFEKRGILVPEVEVRYYPVSDSSGQVDYIDIADTYRNYLMESQGVTKSAAADKTALYVDFYGGTMKTETVLGLPIRMQHKATSFKDAQKILQQLKDLGVGDIVVQYNQWTTDDIKEKVSDKANAASKLGGNGAFDNLMAYANANDITIYPAVDNLTFKSGSGYFTMTDTAIRVSNSYSRQMEYDLAHGIENKYYKSLSLLSPRKYAKVFDNLADSYKKNGLKTISVGSATTVIYGDYGRNSVSRERFKYNLQEYMADLQSSVGSIFADGANAYVLKYVDHVSDVPLNSSKYDLFDVEVPFYQIVMSGLKPVSGTAVNGDAQIADLILRSVAAGSNVRFDFVADEANELKDTKYDKYFYADYRYWVEDAAGCYKFANDILSDVAGVRIAEYNILPNGEIETVYENGTKTVVNLENKTVTKNGNKISLYDYVGKEVIG